MALWLSIALGIFAAKVLEDTIVFGFKYTAYRRARARQEKAKHLQQMVQNVTPISKKKGAKDGEVPSA